MQASEQETIAIMQRGLKKMQVMSNNAPKEKKSAGLTLLDLGEEYWINLVGLRRRVLD